MYTYILSVCTLWREICKQISRITDAKLISQVSIAYNTRKRVKIRSSLHEFAQVSDKMRLIRSNPDFVKCNTLIILHGYYPFPLHPRDFQ